ncbi:MAG TPA: DUF2627 domain-containing protein [Pseudogracilibacillus sp.]|nr:DUF2627 domain-containing protein [Pseudogracilibacillus sp.]
MVRFVAVLILFIPGVIGAYGIKLMRDALFSDITSILFNDTIQFIVGLIMFIAGFSFVAGFIFHRDKKRNKLKSQQKEK